MTKRFQASSNWKLFLPYLKDWRSYYLLLILSVITGIITGISSGFGVPILLKFIAQKIFAPQQDSSFLQILFYCSLPILLMSIRAIASFLNSYLLAAIGQKMMLSMRMRIFQKVQRLPLEYFHRTPAGEIITNASNDVSLIQSCFMSVAHDIIQGPVTLLGALAAVLFICMRDVNIWMLLLLLILIGVSAFPLKNLGRRIHSRNLKTQNEIALQTNHLTQNLEAVQEVRAFCMEERECDAYLEANQRFSKAYLRAVSAYYSINPTVEIIAALGISLAMLYSHYLHIPGDTFLAIGSALYFSYGPVKTLGRMNGNIQCALASVIRIDRLLNYPEGIQDPKKPQKLEHPSDGIEFRNVSFEYEPDHPIFKSINLHLEGNRSYALVGKSGAGKTTFANLLLRFYDVTDGAIEIGGVDIRNVRQKDLRQTIGFVPQQPTLINDTIANNLRWGKIDATDKEIQKAIHLAQADEFINKLENGIQTIVGEDGACMSGGQRQRLAIARAFLKDAPILILDEATSALDQQSEYAINHAMRSLMKNRTVFIISHRFSMLPYVDEILVFDKGEIVQRGSHKQLLSEEGLYKELFLKQNEE